MSYIIMGVDECNQEFRPNEKEYGSRKSAERDLDAITERYVEARGFWVEEHKDMQYYTDLMIKQQY
jgi:hypothetical protein